MKRHQRFVYIQLLEINLPGIQNVHNFCGTCLKITSFVTNRDCLFRFPNVRINFILNYKYYYDGGVP